MASDLTRLRIERKYRLQPAEADLFESTLPASGPRQSYEIATGYLDRPDGSLAATARASPTNYTKLRLRSYLEDPDRIWVELKRCAGILREKHRFAIPESAVPDLLFGRRVRPSKSGARAREALDLLKRLAPGPRVLVGVVRAVRTAFRAENSNARACIDRAISYHRAPERFPADGVPACLRTEAGCILELKYEREIPPPWKAALQTRTPVRYSKYFMLLACLEDADPIPSPCGSTSKA